MLIIHMIGNVLIEFDDNENEAFFSEVYFQAYHKVIDEDGQTNDVFIRGAIWIVMRKETVFGKWFTDQKS